MSLKYRYFSCIRKKLHIIFVLRICRWNRWTTSCESSANLNLRALETVYVYSHRTSIFSTFWNNNPPSWPQESKMLPLSGQLRLSSVSSSIRITDKQLPPTTLAVVGLQEVWKISDTRAHSSVVTSKRYISAIRNSRKHDSPSANIA